MNLSKQIVRVIFSISLTLNSIIIFSQNTEKEIDLSNLQPPTSPGFSILDISPNVIERPKTVREFTVSTVNLFNNGLTIPKNFAFEIVPGWLLGNKGYTFSQLTGLYATT